MQTISRTKRVKLLCLLLFLPLFGQAQTASEIPLSAQMDSLRLGLWEQGNYKVYVGMDELELRCRQTGNSFLTAMKNNGYPDSIHSVYQVVADRYLLAADQLKNAENGFDLRKLVVYQGAEDEKQNTGNSFLVENDVRQSVEIGKAVVYVKGERTYKLQHLAENAGSDMFSGMNMIIYFEDVNDYVFKYHVPFQW